MMQCMLQAQTVFVAQRISHVLGLMVYDTKQNVRSCQTELSHGLTNVRFYFSSPAGPYSACAVCYIVMVQLAQSCHLKFKGQFSVAGLLCDLLWADPDKETMGWGENDRGVSFTFGPEIVSKFLTKHDLDLICRAHQVYIPNVVLVFLKESTMLCGVLAFCRWWKMAMSSLPRGS